MSEIKVNSVVNSTGDNDSGLDLATNDQVKVKIANAEDFIFKANSLEVQTGSNIDMNGTELILDSDGDTSITSDTDDQIDFKTGGTDRVTIDSSGRLLMGMTTSSATTQGFRIIPSDFMAFTTTATDAGDRPLILNRQSADGFFIEFKKANSAVGSIDVNNNDNLVIQGNSSHCGLEFGGDAIFPHKNSANVDNQIDLGEGTLRFDDVFATNGTIQTSDQNEKQDTASLTSKELNVAKKLSALFKTFRWKDKVAEKGDKARTHTGIIAQEVQSAFSAEGLDASKYGLFTSSTWWQKEIKVEAVKENKEKEIEAKDAYSYMDTKNEKTDGYTERTRLGVRYPELFSFIFSSIEARLTALESK